MRKGITFNPFTQITEENSKFKASQISTKEMVLNTISSYLVLHKKIGVAERKSQFF